MAGDENFRIAPVARGELIPPGERSAADLVVHAAWPPNDSESWTPFRDWSLCLRASAADRGAWFVSFGSGVEAYSAHPGLGEPYRSYAHRKLELRDALADLHREHLVWLRLHFMFGPGELPSRLVPAAIRAGVEGGEFQCGSLGRQRRWLHVDDQAHYLADFLKAPEQGEWDIAGRHDVSFRDLLALVGSAIGRKLQLRESGALAPDSELPVIVPERTASVVPADAGDLDSLLRRLREYSAQLTGTSTDHETRLS